MAKRENIEPDPSISNGTCFYSPHREASRNFIPCGNWVFGHVQCCQAGDKCLSHNACYNNDYGTTYLAGCSRFNFDDPSCPDKKSYKDYIWAGLIYCRPNRWVACEEKRNSTSIHKGDECRCPPKPESATVAFSAPSVLEDVALLPDKYGGTIEWYAGHLPATETTSTIPSSTSETTDSSTTATTTPSLSNTPLPTPTNPPESQPPTLSTGSKAGIGIGSAVGAILLFGALSALWVVFRRRNNTTTKDTTTPSNNPSPETGHPARGLTDKPPTLPEMPAPDVPPRPAYCELPVGPPWVLRPELPGDGAATPRYSHHSHASSPPPPVSPASSSGLGWHHPQQETVGGQAVAVAQGWGMGNPALPTVVEERGCQGCQGGYGLGQHGRGQGQGHGQWGEMGQAQSQGQDQWAGGGERPRQGEGVVLELPA